MRIAADIAYRVLGRPWQTPKTRAWLWTQRQQYGMGKQGSRSTGALLLGVRIEFYPLIKFSRPPLARFAGRDTGSLRRGLNDFAETDRAPERHLGQPKPIPCSSIAVR